jgi:hypothetical protein
MGADCWRAARDGLITQRNVVKPGSGAFHSRRTDLPESRMSGEGNLSTRVYRGPRKPPLPADPGAPTEMQVYGQAPTLMGGAAPGAQGDVKVWAPDRKDLQKMAVICGSGTVVMLAIMIISRHSGIFIVWIGILALGFFASISALRRPGYITTDQAGIGITMGRGSRAVRWGEIESVRLVRTHGWIPAYTLVLKVPEKVKVNVTGYPDKQRDRLIALITSRSRLTLSSVTRQIWKREPAAALPASRDRPLPSGGERGKA